MFLHLFKKMLSFSLLFKGQQSIFISGLSRGHFSTALLHTSLFLLAFQEKSSFGVIIWAWEGGVVVCLDLLGHSEQVLRLHESFSYVWQSWERKNAHFPVEERQLEHLLAPFYQGWGISFGSFTELLYQRCACCSSNVYNAAQRKELAHPLPAIVLVAACTSWTP